MRPSAGTQQVARSSLPLPLAYRNWSGFVLGAVLTTTGIATWSFVVGGTTAYYLDAKMGAVAMIAGGLIGQLLVTLATVPASTKYGLETVVSTKPQLGVRGSYIGLFMMYCNALGWNAVLMIFFGRATASVLELLGVIEPSSRTWVATLTSVAGLLLVGFMVSRGAKALSKTGPIIAGSILLLSLWMVYLLLQEFGASAIAAAEPLAPTDNRLLNYTTIVEMLIGGTFGWWGYMGGLVRMSSSARKAIMPSMIGLGLAWTLVAVVSLFGALMTGEIDPTIWVTDIAGKTGAVVILLFIALANIGSTLVGAYIATLGVKQIPGVGGRMSWRAVVVMVLAPMMLVLVLFADYLFDNIGIFMAFLGMVTGPMIGVQIADWFVLRRRSSMVVSSLYVQDSTSAYWYYAGFNPAGIIALVLGSLTYLMILNPYTLVPNSSWFPYITASLPAVLAAGIVYVASSRLIPGLIAPTATVGRGRSSELAANVEQ